MADGVVTPRKIREEIERAVRIFRDGRTEQKLALLLAFVLAGLSYLAFSKEIPLISQERVKKMASLDGVHARKAGLNPLRSGFLGTPTGVCDGARHFRGA